MWTKLQADSNSWSAVHKPDTLTTMWWRYTYKQFTETFKSPSCDLLLKKKITLQGVVRYLEHVKHDWQ